MSREINTAGQDTLFAPNPPNLPPSSESGSEERRRSTALLLADAVEYTDGHSLKTNVLIAVLTQIATAKEFTEEMETRALDGLIYAGYKVTPTFDPKKWEEVAGV